ncbi:MAG: hypothetical protein ACRCZK_06935 [Oscillospiraceae bacterium]
MKTKIKTLTSVVLLISLLGISLNAYAKAEDNTSTSFEESNLSTRSRYAKIITDHIRVFHNGNYGAW